MLNENSSRIAIRHLSLSLSLSLSLLQAVLIPRGGVSHIGSPSPLISVSSILWFEASTSLAAPFQTISSAFLIFSTHLSTYLRCTRPYHRSLASRIFSVIQATPTALRIVYSKSFSNTPSIHRNILIFILSNLNIVL